MFTTSFLQCSFVILSKICFPLTLFIAVLMILTKYLFTFSIRLTEQSVTTVAGNACWDFNLGICFFSGV